MAALLRKDFYVLWRYSSILLSLALLFNIFPTFRTLGNTYAILLVFLLPLSSIATDERCKWDRFAAMLPYRVEQIVWSKYLLSYIYALAGVVIMAVGAAARGIREPGAAEWGETAETIFMLLLSMLLVTAGMPLIYRFGSETGRMVVRFLMAAGAGVFVSVFGYVIHSRPSWRHPAVWMAAAAMIAGATYLSYRLSVYFYRQRDCAYH